MSWLWSASLISEFEQKKQVMAHVCNNDNMYLFLQNTCNGWVIPLSNSLVVTTRSFKFVVGGRGSQPKPLLATITGKGDYLYWDHWLQHQRFLDSQGDNLPHRWATLKGMHHVGTRDFQVSMAWGDCRIWVGCLSCSECRKSQMHHST